MLYQNFQDLKLSWLGMGAMRLPVNEKNAIDEGKAREMLEYAYAQGINYYDTAFGYHGGESERFVGRVMKQFPRGSWYLASKMPGHMMRWEEGKLAFQGYMAGEKYASPQEIFEEQLRKCQVEYFDFYLLHNLCETAYDFYTDEDLRVVDYLLEQKKAGRIRHLGFSAHGRAETIEKFLQWNSCFEFAQIQLNYMDWYLQDAGAKYEVLTKYGIPIVVMEPVRGGLLATLNEKARGMLKEARPRDSIASWAFRHLQSLPGVKVVLSGMSTLDQLKENIEIFSKNDPTTEEENALLRRVVDSMADFVPCTGCRYCCDDCPADLDIPKLITMYNETRLGPAFTQSFTLGAMAEGELPSACLSCGACSPMCPQSIDIPDIMGKYAQALAR